MGIPPVSGYGDATLKAKGTHTVLLSWRVMKSDVDFDGFYVGYSRFKCMVGGVRERLGDRKKSCRNGDNGILSGNWTMEWNRWERPQRSRKEGITGLTWLWEVIEP